LLEAGNIFASSCGAALVTMDSLPGVDRVQYIKGKLMWWGGNFQLQVKSLEVAVPCQPLKVALKELTDRWCIGKESCETHFPGGLMLDEGGLKPQPWDLFVYKKSLPGKRGWAKTVACTKPTQPHTRSSGENCCTWKQLNDNHPPQIALL